MCDNEKSQLLRLIKQNLRETGHRLKGRPFTVAFVGAVGVGKSSLINTVAAAMSTVSWRAHAYSGRHGGLGGEPVTVFTTRFKQCCRPEEHNDPILPTLLDTGGLSDQLDEDRGKALRLLLYGRVPEEENFYDVIEYVKNQDSFPYPKYTKVYNHLKVDRIIVVASATSEVPVNLIKTVMEVARPTKESFKRSSTKESFKRSIPVFGVMTKIDLVDTSDIKFAQREKLLIEALCLEGETSRFARCINYCSQIDPDNNRIFTTYPYLDVPVLRLMTQVCDPALDVVHADENDGDDTSEDNTSIFLLCFCAVVLLLAIFSPLLNRTDK